MTITITAFGHPMAARDWRVIRAFAGRWRKWVTLRGSSVSFRAMKEPAHLALHPFGQIPTYEEGDLGLFETGRSCPHRERHAGLLPDDAYARARDHMDVRRAQHGGAADP